ncbi:hypothetical protein [Fervidibacillus albus]|uniref:Uncharacterized protein n=1 Tax=Fervidibacillus albus TaxID=2980026 RepID=A0A9E8LTA8_9BACI|nr:hypothetical protein [Fervidibacillus albus]WAA09223.1 hypothetical protein OE104_11645 [Fervidibacillus albus]
MVKGRNFTNRLKRCVFDRLHFLKMEELDLPEEAVKEFDEMFEQVKKGDGQFLSYRSKFPKHLFLTYIVERRNVLLHGTNNREIKVFQPRKQTLANGKPVTAVFAASDGIWPIFFAIINRSKYKGTLRNLCLTVPTKMGNKRYYYFSVNKEFPGDYWTTGTIYIFSKDSFQPGGIRNEWVCETKIKPLAKLSVTPEDFPFLKDVNQHVQSEHPMITMVKVLLLKK